MFEKIKKALKDWNDEINQMSDDMDKLKEAPTYYKYKYPKCYGVTENRISDNPPKAPSAPGMKIKEDKIIEDNKIYLNLFGNYITEDDVTIDKVNKFVYIQMNGFKLKVELEKYERGLTLKDVFEGEQIID